MIIILTLNSRVGGMPLGAVWKMLSLVSPICRCPSGTKGTCGHDIILLLFELIRSSSSSPSPLDMPLIQVHSDAHYALENFFLVGMSIQCLSKVLTSSWIERFLHDHCFTEFSRFLTSLSYIIKTQTVVRHGYWSILSILYVCVHDSRHFYIFNPHDINLQKEGESGGKLWIWPSGVINHVAMTYAISTDARWSWSGVIMRTRRNLVIII